MSGAFFAELSAKVCHHNIHVAREGCTMLSRLLTTDISALLVLSEGKLLALLQDVLSGVLLGGSRGNRSSNDANAETPRAFGYGMRVGADGGTAGAAGLSGAAAAHTNSFLPTLTPSVWQEAELVLQILDVLLLFSEKLLSFVGPQSSTQHKAVAAMVEQQQHHQQHSSAQNPYAQQNDNYLRHLDNADMFFLSFGSVLASIIALPPRRGVVAMTQGRFRHAFYLVAGWCSDISPYFVKCVLASFGADSSKGKSEAAMRVLMLTNGFITPSQLTETMHHAEHGSSSRPLLTANGNIYMSSADSERNGIDSFMNNPAVVASITDAATTALNRLGPQKSLLSHKIEGFFLSRTNGPPSGFSSESAIDFSFYRACRKLWRLRSARLRALLAPYTSDVPAKISFYTSINGEREDDEEDIEGGEGHFVDGGQSSQTMSANNKCTHDAAAADGFLSACADTTLDEPEGISIISANGSIYGSRSESVLTGYKVEGFGGGMVSSRAATPAGVVPPTSSALNKTPDGVSSDHFGIALSGGGPYGAMPPHASPPHRNENVGEKPATSPAASSYQLHLVQVEVEELRKQLESAQSHEVFCDGLSRLWGAVTSAIANGVNPERIFDFTPREEAARASTAATSIPMDGRPKGILRPDAGGFIPIGGPTGFTKFFLDALRRVFSTLPANTKDAVVFHWSLRLLGVLLQHSTSTIPYKKKDNPHNKGLREVILGGCCPFLVTALSAASGVAAAAATAQHESEREDLMRHFPHYDPTAINPPQRRNAPARLTLVSTEMEILNFLRTAEECSTSSQLEPWIRSGLFSALVNYVEPFGSSSSLLTDAPTIHDGALSEDVYLASALQMCRGETCVLATAAMKLLCAVVTNHSAMICEVFPSEAYSCLTIAVPLFSRVAINNPTVELSRSSSSSLGECSDKGYLTSGVEGGPSGLGEESVSLVYRLPRCHRSSRHTPVGECAVLALDALLCLPLCLTTSSQISESLVPFLPSLARATVRSVFPHLRGTLFRTLTRTITTATDLLNLVKTMPSAVSSAVAVVVSYDGAAMREWEVSAAAEWLAQVLRLTLASDRDNANPQYAGGGSSLVTSFNFLQTALPIRLLQMCALSGPSYISGALLSLLIGIVRQQQLLTTAGGRGLLGQHSALAPQSARSLPHWRVLINNCVSSLKFIREKWGGAELDDEGAQSANAGGSAGQVKEQGRRPSQAGGKGTPSVRIAEEEESANPHPTASVAKKGKTTAPATTSYCSTDAPHRYVAAMEAVTSQLLYVHGVLRGLSFLFHHHVDLREHLSQEEMLNLLETVLRCPTPEIMASTMSSYYRTDLLYSKPLQRSFEQMIRSLCDLYSTGWYSALPHRDVQHNPLPIPCVLIPMARLVCDRSLSSSCRQCFAVLLSSIISKCVPQHMALSKSIADVSDAFFLATTCLPPSPTTIGLQCRLVSSFELANKAAYRSGWVDMAVRSAYQIVMGRGATATTSTGNMPPAVALSKLDAVKEHQLTELMSIVASSYSLPNCEATKEDRDVEIGGGGGGNARVDSAQARRAAEERADLLSRLLLRLLAASTSSLRLLGLNTCRALASSAEGRSVLSVGEGGSAIAATGGSRAFPADSSDKSCFMKLAYNSLGAVMNATHFANSSSSSVAVAPQAASSPSRRGQQATTPVRRAPSANGGRSVVGRLSSSPPSPSSYILSSPSGSATSRLPHHLTPEFHIGVDIISVIISKSGGEGGGGQGETHFAQAIIKQRCVEHVETYVLHLTRGRQAVPIALYRFLAAVSFRGEVQPVMCKRPELLTLLYEMASMTVSGLYGAAPTSEGKGLGGEHQFTQQHFEKSSLALLALRNLCFYSPAKLQICQDSRIMLLFKDCLVAATGSSSSYSLSGERGVGGEGRGVGRSVFHAGDRESQHSCTPPTLELFRRQQLAISALAALVHGNQRGKSYVRGLLAQPPAVDIAALLPSAVDCEDGCGEDVEGTIGSGGSPAQGSAAYTGNPYLAKANLVTAAPPQRPLPTATAFDFCRRNTTESAALLHAMTV